MAPHFPHAEIQGKYPMTQEKMTQRYDAVLFDLDGTLLDTLDDLTESMNSVLVRMGHPPHERDAYKYFVGNGIRKLAKRCLPEDCQDDDSVKSCMETMREEYGKRWAEKTRPYDGIPELLGSLQDLGIKKVVLSNKPDALTRVAVNHFLSEWRFDLIKGAIDGVPKKPDPVQALEMAKMLHIPPARFLYLGDTNTDMRTACAAGMTPIGALWGFRTESELMESGAAHVIKRPEELLGLLMATKPTKQHENS